MSGEVKKKAQIIQGHRVEHSWKNHSCRQQEEEMTRHAGGNLELCSNESQRKSPALLDAAEVSNEMC